MDIKFDPVKNQANIAKHGVSLARADELAGVVVVEDARFEETRFRLYGTIDGVAHCAAASSASSVCAAPTPRRCAVMASESPPVVFDHDNPEWTSDDAKRARPIADFPKLAKAFPNGSKPRGRPKGSITSEKSLVSLRIDNDVLERFRATGPGWQSRINETLRRAKPSV